MKMSVFSDTLYFDVCFILNILLCFVSVKTSQDTDSLIQAYIHQHVWMLFTLLAISMGDVIYTNEGNTSLSLDQEYTSLAAQLQNKCISISTHCLQQVPDDAEGKCPR